MAQPFIQARSNFSLRPDTSQFRMHTHDTKEIFFFQEGNAKCYVEGTVYDLEPEDILVIKRAEAHLTMLRPDRPYRRIHVHFNADALLSEDTRNRLRAFDGKPLGKNNRYAAAKFRNRNWRNYLENISRADTLEERQIYLTVLINEMLRAYPDITDCETDRDLIGDIIEYINENLAGELSLEIICKQFFISPTHLNRRFKQVTGSTVWDYIVIKRLMLAKELLNSGVAPTTVYTKCGFLDYCSFYKRYKSKFGTSPKMDHIK